MTRLFSNLLEFVGLAAIVCGAYLFDWRLAAVVGGAVLVLVGFALDTPRRGADS